MDVLTKSMNAAVEFVKKNIVLIIIFLAALFFIITFSNPALFLNDEWITANQLTQLDNGQQLIFNEGKYGTFLNGTPGEYFKAHDNLLGYTLMLPILSLPALELFSLFGDQFRFFVILLWSLIPILIVLLVEKFRPKWLKVGNVSIRWPVIFTAFAFMLLNIFLYYPFRFWGGDAPKEVAALVFTNHILFALTAVSIFLICRYIFKNDWYALFGTIACISCSSFLFWAANAKDHMLTVAFTAFVLLFMIRYIVSDKPMDAIYAFFFMGLLAWARPEVGAAVFVFSLVYYLGYNLYNGERRSKFVKLGIFAPIFTVLGAVPFFINNNYITGNPLVPSFYVYMEKVQSSAGMGGNPIGVNTINNVSYSVPGPSGGLDTFVNIIQSQTNFNFVSLISDTFGVLLNPESGNMGVGIVCPLFFIGIVTLLFLYIKGRQDGPVFSGKDFPLIVFLVFAVVAVWAAYFNRLHGMNISSGVIPDIRYMTPAYLPMGLLGIFGISKIYHKYNSDRKLDEKKITLAMILSVFTVAPLLIFVLVFIHPFGVDYYAYTDFFSFLVYLMTLITIVSLILAVLGKIPVKWFIFSAIILISVPLAWQMVMLFMYSAAKFNGYSFWIPFVERLYSSIFTVYRV